MFFGLVIYLAGIKRILSRTVIMSDRMKILVLTPDMAGYTAAYYQQDFLNELTLQADCVFFGPGYAGYDQGLSINDVLSRAPFRPDVVLTAHGFLQDNPTKPLLSVPISGIRDSPVPVAGIINKEYSRLSEKIDFFRRSNYSLVFTHHHSLRRHIGPFPTRVSFLPFGVDVRRFEKGPEQKVFDLGFSGLLRNANFGHLQPETREEIFNHLFVTLSSMKVRKRRKYSDVSISWNSWTGNRAVDIVSSAFFGNRKLSTDEYRRRLQLSKLWLNSPSPLDLVSTRYFESMASGAVVLAQESDGVRSVFPGHLIRTYSSPSDFPSTFLSALEDVDALKHTADAAHVWVLENGTWSKRVEKLLGELQQVVSKY